LPPSIAAALGDHLPKRCRLRNWPVAFARIRGQAEGVSDPAAGEIGRPALPFGIFTAANLGKIGPAARIGGRRPARERNVSYVYY